MSSNRPPRPHVAMRDAYLRDAATVMQGLPARPTQRALRMQAASFLRLRDGLQALALARRLLALNSVDPRHLCLAGAAWTCLGIGKLGLGRWDAAWQLPFSAAAMFDRARQAYETAAVYGSEADDVAWSQTISGVQSMTIPWLGRASSASFRE